MFGINSPSAMRMLQALHAAHTAPAPEPQTIRQPTSGGKSRGRRAPSPPPPPADYSDTESEYSDDSATSASSSSYESDTDVIYSHVVETKKCPYVSPAGLKAKSTSGKEAIKHLKAKKCPEVPALKKGAKIKMNDPATPAPAPAAPAPVAAAPTPAAQPEAPKRVRKVTKKTVAAEAPAPASAPAPAPAPAPPAAAPEAPKAAAAAGKAKRAPSAYNLFVKEHLKAGKAMIDIGKLWKASKEGK